jgi:predicted nucleotidyltransferase component of viral defense system
VKLHKNKIEFAQSIQAASTKLGIREVFIEKDYWVCFILKNLSLSKEYKPQVVFKGGT